MILWTCTYRHQHKVVTDELFDWQFLRLHKKPDYLEAPVSKE